MRFTVGSVTGWPISDRTSRPNYARPVVSIWYVHDSAFCHRIMAEFRPGVIGVKYGYDRMIIGRRSMAETPESFARRYAAKLEEMYA